MRIRNHRLSGVPFERARWTGSKITPEIVVLHDTASRLEAGRAREWLRDNPRKVSVHFVVELDGQVVQMVPTDRRANHAGRSHYHGRSGVNGFSIGIELVNPGRMTRWSASRALTWWGQQLDIELFGIREVETPEHGAGLWMPYPEAQLAALNGLLEALFQTPSLGKLADIVTHWYVSPGRKVDTNPLFPLEAIRARILGRDDPRDVMAEAAALAAGNDEFVVIDVPGDTLNLRRWPSFNPNVIGRIPDGAVVPVLARGKFSGRDWLKVLHAGQEGWVVAAYSAALTQREVPA